VLLIVLLLAEAVEMVAGISTPIAEQLPVEALGGVEVARLVALALIALACFLAGALLRTRFGAWSTAQVERAIFDRLPGYSLLRSVTRRFGGAEESALFSAALADLHGSEARVFVFIVEEHEDGSFTVLVPNAPTPSVGTLYLLPQRRVQRLAVPPATAVNTFMQWGIGSKSLLGGGAAGGPAARPA
jgi:uncharacterized membrane protein